MADFINSLLVDFACPRLYHTQARPALFMMVRGDCSRRVMNNAGEERRFRQEREEDIHGERDADSAL